MKLNQLLALTEQGNTRLREGIKALLGYFKSNQGDFSGERRTYTPKEGFEDDPTKRGFRRVVTTVDEKFDYFIKNYMKYYQNQLDQEKTNALGSATANLTIGEFVWENLTSLELLRLKNIFFSPELRQMIERIPTRSDAEEWRREDGDNNRNIYQTPISEFVERTTLKSTKVLVDPNIERAISAGKDINYTPQTTTTSEIVVKGEGTFTKFSGHWTQEKRALSLKMLDEIKDAITDALQRANDTEVQKSECQVSALFEILLGQ